MDKMIEVREFQPITCNKDYEEDEYYKYLKDCTFKQLESFIHTFQGTDEAAEAIDFMKVSSRRGVGEVIQAKNYVGLIQMKNGFQIQILPKLSFDTEDTSNKETKKIFLRMLRSMKDFPSKVFNDANMKSDRMNLYEIFINMYIQEVRELVKKGMRSAYIPVDDNLHYYKGKLRVNEHIKSNLIHKERFYVAYDEFQVNRPENKLIKATLLKLQNVSSSAENIKEIRQLLSHFEKVEPSKNNIKDLSKVVINRNTKNYETLMQWSKVFLTNQSFTTFSGDSNARALLFPMEKVFEAYVAKNMKKIFCEIGWEVTTQDKGYYLFDTPKQFALRPDIVMRYDKRTIILDTKWKLLTNNPNKNYGISQADMYQMYAYSKKYKTPEIWLLYPKNEEMKGLDDISFESDDSVKVNIFFVDVANIEVCLVRLKDLLMERI